MAASLLNQMSDDELIRVMPQLTQALRYETYECSPLAGKILMPHTRNTTINKNLGSIIFIKIL